MNLLRRIAPTVLAGAAFVLAGYLYLSLREMNAKLNALAPAPAERPGPGTPDQAARIRQLEERLAELSRKGGGDLDAGAARADIPPPPARVEIPLPKEPARQEPEAAKRLNAARFHPPAFVTPEGRRRWLSDVAPRLGLRPAQLDTLARVLEEEAARWNEIIGQQAAGLRSASEAWAALSSLDREFQPRFDRILDPEQQSPWNREHAQALSVADTPQTP